MVRAAYACECASDSGHLAPANRRRASPRSRCRVDAKPACPHGRWRPVARYTPAVSVPSRQPTRRMTLHKRDKSASRAAKWRGQCGLVARFPERAECVTGDEGDFRHVQSANGTISRIPRVRCGSVHRHQRLRKINTGRTTVPQRPPLAYVSAPLTSDLTVPLQSDDGATQDTPTPHLVDAEDYARGLDAWPLAPSAGRRRPGADTFGCPTQRFG